MTLTNIQSSLKYEIPKIIGTIPFNNKLKKIEKKIALYSSSQYTKRSNHYKN